MAKDKPSAEAEAKARPRKKKQAGKITRGKSHDELLLQRKSLKKEIHSLPADQRSRVMTHFHGGNDLSKQRLQNLRQDDRSGDTSNLTNQQVRALDKRRSRPNMALSRQMHRRETKRLRNAVDAADVEEILRPHRPGLVEPENDLERTMSLTQNELKNDHLDENTARNIFDLELKDHAPYIVRYDRSGRHALLAGERGGHVAVVDQHTMALRTEFFLRERVRDACFLQSGDMMAVSQEDYVYIYDEEGREVHKLDGHRRVGGMEFLPYHWLLATVGGNGVLQYQDTSTGSLVSQHRSKLGPCKAVRQNPFNSVMHLGHCNGTVTLWSPSSSEYLVKMLCHKGSPITSLAMDRSGRYMATGGGDCKVKIWDLRTYKELHQYRTFGGPPTGLDISQTGMLGVGHGCHARFWRPEALRTRADQPYMKHAMRGRGPVRSLRFRPFEDVCGIGNGGGMSSVVIPGCGEPNLDSMEHFTNPYSDRKQRREEEVRSLMEKLSPDMIALDPDSVGGIEESNMIQRQQRLRDLAEQADAKKMAEKEAAANKKEKKRMRGRSKIAKKLRRKKKNIIDENMVKLKELREKEKMEIEEKKRALADDDEEDDKPAALKRFF